MVMQTRRSAKLAAILGEDYKNFDPIKHAEKTMQSAITLIRELRKDETQLISFEDMEELVKYKKFINDFKKTPFMEKHFLLHTVIAEEILKLIDAIEINNN